VSIFRVSPAGRREPFVSGIVNPTSLAFDSYGNLYVSSRFEGAVYRVRPDGSHETFASNLGVTCGLAFDRDDVLYVGDRTGTVFRIEAGGRAKVLATLPSSVAAYHLAAGPGRAVYVSGPTLGSYDHVYRIATDDGHAGEVEAVYSGFGRPQGLAVDSQGSLYVIEALAGWSGLYRVPTDGKPELVVAGPSLVGVAFDPQGGVVVASNETAYHLQVGVRPFIDRS
jgi:sugar lactone lactonase YvrE